MPLFKEFFTQFNTLDLTITLVIIFTIVGIRERKNILKIFNYGKENKKESLHTEE